jgi:hypothetical protein
VKGAQDNHTKWSATGLVAARGRAGHTENSVGLCYQLLKHRCNIVKRLALGVSTQIGPVADGCRETVRCQRIRIVWPYEINRVLVRLAEGKVRHRAVVTQD